MNGQGLSQDMSLFFQYRQLLHDLISFSFDGGWLNTLKNAQGKLKWNELHGQLWCSYILDWNGTHSNEFHKLTIFKIIQPTCGF